MAPVKYNNLDVSKISVSKLEDNDRVQSQKLSYVRYVDGEKNDQFMLQTPEIVLTTYGIPKHHDKWYPSDDKRSFIKVPLDDSTESIKLLKQKLMEIDALYGSEEFRKKTFGDKFADKYEYVSIVREPQEAEEDEESANKKKDEKKKLDIPKPFYFKVKLDTEWQTNKILTKVFVKSSEGRQEVTEDQLTCIDDLHQLVNYRSTVRMIVMFNKFYAMKNAPGGSKKKYGFTIKVKQIETQPYIVSKKANNNTSDAFIDDDDDLELLKKTSNYQPTETISRNTKVSSLLDNNSEEEVKLDDKKQDKSSKKQETKPSKKQIIQESSEDAEEVEEEQDEEELIEEEEEIVEEVKPKKGKSQVVETKTIKSTKSTKSRN